MITQLSGTNVKGIDFDYALGQVNMVVGDNFSGKSAVLEAIRLALHGYVARLGKQPGATMELAGELKNEMTVRALFGETPVFQKWTRNKKGGASYEIEGELLKIPPVLLDINDYFDRTAAERVKFVFDKIDLKRFGFDDEQILARLGKIETTPAALSVIAVKAMLEVVQKTIADRGRFKLTRQVWMDQLLAKLKSEAASHKSNADFNSGQQSSLGKQLPPKSPKDVKADLEAKEKEFTALGAKVNDLNNAFAQWQRNEKRRGELAAMLATPVAEPSQKQIQEIEAKCQKLEESLNRDNSKLARLREQRKNQIRQIDDAEKEIAEWQTKIAEIATKSTCPYCKSKRQGWQDEVRSELEALIIAKQGIIGGYRKNIDKIEAEGKPLRESADALTKTLAEGRAASKKAVEDYTVALTQFNNYTAAVAESANMDQVNPKPDLTELPALDEKLSALGAEVDALRKQQQEFEQFSNLRARKDDVEKKAIECSIHEKIFKMAAKELTEIQSDMINTAIGDVLEKARTLTDGILKAPLEYRDGNLGMTWENGWIGHKTFSGTEEVLAFSAFALALADESPLKIILIDEMDRIREDRRVLLVERMIDLAAKGVIHQFVGAGLESKIYEPLVKAGKLNLIRVG